MEQKKRINWPIIFLVILSIIFSFIYSFLSRSYIYKDLNKDLIFNSPDETANYYFAYIFAKDSKLQFSDPANQIVGNLVTPRSMMVINGKTVPASFLGLPLIAGTLAKIFGQKTIFFVVIFFAFLGIIFFYLLIKELFNGRIAFLSSLLLLINPAWWYYATKSLMPNVLFVSLLIIGLYLFFIAVKLKNIWLYLLFGLVIGLTFMVRTSEITWLSILLLILAIFCRKKIKWWYLALSFIICLLSFIPIFYFNFQNYHSIFSFGYVVDLELAGKNFITQGINIFEKIFLPFGFYPKTALINLYNYTIKIFPFWSIISLISLFIFSLLVIFKKDKKRRIFLILFLLISGYLTLYYGCWKFNDNPNPQAITIGNSYVRYWLPIYVFILPIISYCTVKFFKNSKIALYFLSSVLFICLGSVSLKDVYLGQDEGLWYVNNNLKEYEIIQHEVNSKIEDNAIIIADTMDKVFFPRHSVIFRLNNDYDYQRVSQLIEAGYPVYYFYFTRNNELLARFNDLYYFPHGLEVMPSILDFKEESLYPVKLIN